MKGAGHIDDAQPATVDEHFKLLQVDRSIFSTEFVKVTPEDLPEWFDERLFKIGQAVYMDNTLGFSIATISGIAVGLSIPSIAEVLISTKRSSTVSLCFKRYAETALLIHELFRSDVLKADSKWFKAINVIRWKHAMAGKRLHREGHHGIYMRDMSLTIFGFIGYAFICPEKFGLSHCTLEEMTGFNHFWRVTGHLLGISDRLNLCRKNAAETTEMCRKVAHDIIKIHLEDHSPDVHQLMIYMVKGLSYVDPTLNTDAIMSLSYECAGAKYTKPLGWNSIFNTKFRETVFYFHSAPYIGVGTRIFFKYLVGIIYWSTEHYPLLARMAFGKAKSRICLFPKIE
ncbi:uncharacterized protein LOC128890564 [Hylaeus anthracinus]|uniref:uncharacterized protein LOC128890564 n=1 Tax=Hylaeus anthracinus TaxID=313031 RepID=UPI0023BA1A2C|nr:uncharacterized protein LOC128890564 [Hylaeus anthracinus]